MSSRNERFQGRWQPSPRLVAGCCLALLITLCSTFTLQMPAPVRFALVAGWLAYAAWVLPRHVLLTSANATAMRRTPEGWAVCSREHGRQAVRLGRDSVALPRLVIVGFRAPGQWFTRSACIPADALGVETHRRLRLRLHWGRDRFASPAPQISSGPCP